MNQIIYQIYPKSFCDKNGDGVGDLLGITEKLDYIAALGVDTIWLCPIFSSPMVDNGYDISDYQGIDPQFGTIEDLETLIAKAKERGIGVLLDLVLNHTSDRHRWFLEALGDPTSKYRDYYIFKKGANGAPPNNWRSNFGGSVWEPVPGSDEYYFHAFAKEQPDLNWENPALREELFSMIRWWLQKGVSGFRIDAISFIKKNQRFPVLPPDGPDGLCDPKGEWVVHPGIETFLAEMRDQAFAPFGAYTVAEANGVPHHRLSEFIGENGYFSAVFDFSYTDIDLDNGNWYTGHPIQRAALREAIFASQQALCKAGHGALYLENHDQNRSPNKYLAPAERGFPGVSMLGVLYFFLQGNAFIYEGQELGLPNHPWKSLSQFDDVATHDQYRRAILAGFSEEDALAIVSHRSRDNARTPMLWDNTKNAGFSTATPWLPVHPDYARYCVETQENDPQSVLTFYRRMSSLRQGPYKQLFYDGGFAPAFCDTDNIFAYRRTHNGQCVLVVCNFQNAPCTLPLPGGTLLLGNLRENGSIESGTTELAPFEALVLLEK